MQTVQVGELLGVVVLLWFATAALFRLMGGPFPWPYPRHWRWGSATLDAAYRLPIERARAQAHVLPELFQGQFANVDWLDYNLRRN